MAILDTIPKVKEKLGEVSKERLNVNLARFLGSVPGIKVPEEYKFFSPVSKPEVIKTTAAPITTPTPTPTFQPTPIPTVKDYIKWVPKTPYDNHIDRVFEKRADEARQVLRYMKPDGGFAGENQQFVADKSADWMNPETGITDRGLFRISSKTFYDFLNRKPRTLVRANIYSYDDLLDPIKNIKMAKIIFDEQGWNAWVAAPDWLKT